MSFTKNIGYCAFCYVLYLNSIIFWAKHVSLWLGWAKRKAEQSEVIEKYIKWPSILIFFLISGVLRALIVKGKSICIPAKPAVIMCNKVLGEISAQFQAFTLFASSAVFSTIRKFFWNIYLIYKSLNVICSICYLHLNL